MKKVYSKRIGGEVYALDAEQLKVFAKSGYSVPTPEAVIADAGAVKLLPPKDKQAYAVFNCETGVFAVRTSPATLKNGEIGAFVGEVVQAAIICAAAEKADPDRPKPDAEQSVSPFMAALLRGLERMKEKAPADSAQQAAESPEVTE